MKSRFTINAGQAGALSGVQAFLCVARHRNFRKAAFALGVTPSAMSQTVRALEARLGVALFTRTTRSVSLTEAGEKYLARAKPAFEELLAAADAAREMSERPSGLLRIATPRAVMPVLLEALILSFCEKYPQVEVEVAVNEEMIDLADQGFDAGVRLGQFIAADMVAVRLTPSFRQIVVGSPAYLSRAGRPKRPEDLRSHACLRLRRSNGAIALWSFSDKGRPLDIAVSGRLIANDFPTLLSAAIKGLGLAQTPAPIAEAAIKAGALERVLTPFAPMTPGVFLYYPSRRLMTPKLRAFIDHAKRRTRNDAQ